MAVKRITLAKVEAAQWALGELLDAGDLDPTRRAELERARLVVDSLRPAAPPAAAHTPVAYAPGVIGCSCGYRPANQAARASMIKAAYHSHLAQLGIPRDDTVPVIMGYGPDIGKIW